MSSTVLSRLKTQARYARQSPDLTVTAEGGRCAVCGQESYFTYSEVINDQLAQQWRFSAEERRGYSARESMACLFCGSTFRLRQQARALALVFSGSDKPETTLHDLLDSGAIGKLKIAEINSAGMLHQYLAEIPGLAYSEYGSTKPDVPSEDLSKLSYSDGSFDLVLTSDTLEHVPDPAQAFREIFRILRPGGHHIFTLPVTWGRPTVVRTHLDTAGREVHDREASFHGSGEPDNLVWTEFGDDVLEAFDAAGFDTKLFFVNLGNLADPTVVFVAQKPGKKTLADDYPAIDPVKPPAATDTTHYLGEIAQKLRLTLTHADNLETRLAESTAEVARLRAHQAVLEEKLERIRHSLPYRAWNVFRRLTGRKR